MKRYSSIEYVREATKRLQSEEKTANDYFPKYTEEYMSLIKEIVIRQQTAELVSRETSGVKKLLRDGFNEASTNLKEIYEFIKQVHEARVTQDQRQGQPAKPDRDNLKEFA